jgi:hypothetical protein
VPTTTTITADQRDGLYELVRNHLAGIGDIAIALEERRDYTGAQQLARQFAEDLRLLVDIGWRPDDRRQAFALTMQPPELAKALGRLHEEAERPAERQSREEDEETDRRLLGGLDACEAVLLALDGREGEQA